MSSSSRHSESAKIEQIITEFFAKTLHIILDSRSPCASSRNYSYSGEQTSSPASSTSSTSSVRPRDKWFNLALRECPAALENMDLWRQNNLEPMVVDVVLVKKPVDFDPGAQFPSSWNPREEDFMADMKSEKIIERWIVQYENGKPNVDSNSSKGSKRGGSNNSQALYKKSIILLRSLYLTVRILPAYKLYRDLNSSGQLHTFSLAHRVSSFVEPFTRREEGEMQKFAFAPVETTGGRLSLSVLYCPALSDLSAEPLAPMSPRFIPDYVDSPTTKALKRFPSLPRTGFESQSLPFARRHSWSYGGFRNFPPMSVSPSPTFSDSRAMLTNVNSQLKCLPRHPSENPYSTGSLPHKNSGFDEYWPSLISPSPSPSPPAQYSVNQLSKDLLRTGSAPVGIPTGKLGRNISLPSAQVLQLSPSPRSSNLNSSQTNDARALMKLGDISTKVTTQKISSFGKDDAATLLGGKLSAHSSPRKSFSRSSGRFTLQDDFDDSDFCPFAFDDIGTADPHVRTESFDAKGHINEPIDPGGLLRVGKSQNAAVGSMLTMLKAAPPLCQDLSNIKESLVSKAEMTMNKQIGAHNNNSNRESEVAQNPVCNLGIASSRVLLLKTTSEALEELQVYRDMKNKLLQQGG